FRSVVYIASPISSHAASNALSVVSPFALSKNFAANAIITFGYAGPVNRSKNCTASVILHDCTFALLPNTSFAAAFTCSRLIVGAGEEEEEEEGEEVLVDGVRSGLLDCFSAAFFFAAISSLIFAADSLICLVGGFAVLLFSSSCAIAAARSAIFTCASACSSFSSFPVAAITCSSAFVTVSCPLSTKSCNCFGAFANLSSCTIVATLTPR